MPPPLGMVVDRFFLSLAPVPGLLLLAGAVHLGNLLNAHEVASTVASTLVAHKSSSWLRLSSCGWLAC